MAVGVRAHRHVGCATFEWTAHRMFRDFQPFHTRLPAVHRSARSRIATVVRTILEMIRAAEDLNLRPRRHASAPRWKRTVDTDRGLIRTSRLRLGHRSGRSQKRTFAIRHGWTPCAHSPAGATVSTTHRWPVGLCTTLPVRRCAACARLVHGRYRATYEAYQLLRAWWPYVQRARPPQWGVLTTDADAR